jgi:ABC-type multidrug transport system fused ATPase/permease subunit
VNAMFAFGNVTASYIGPFLINDFVEYLNGRRRFEHEGLTLVLIFSIAKVIENLAQRQWYYGIQYLCLRVKAALTVVVYRKALRLSNTARQSHTSGEIINYISVDVQRVSDFGWYLHQVWILPVEVALALGILYRVVGMAWIAALMAAIVTLLLNTPLERLQEKFQTAVMEAKDKRMKALSECLKNMRVLKLQSWEQRFLLRIEELRQGEYNWLFKDCIARAFQVYIFWMAPIVISVATFGACVLFGIPLTSGRILSAIATFRVLQEALASFPELVSFYAQTRVCC